jgi:hypothetical protein
VDDKLRTNLKSEQEMERYMFMHKYLVSLCIVNKQCFLTLKPKSLVIPHFVYILAKITNYRKRRKQDASGK